jgi:hypothetical protein
MLEEMGDRKPFQVLRNLRSFVPDVPDLPDAVSLSIW